MKRHHEISHFVPEKYWELKTLYRDTTFSATKGKFKEEEDARRLLESIQNEDFHITSVEKKKGTEYAPKLFDLTSLQVECNKRYAFSAEDTLKIIQSLYEKKLTTYPRVDTTYLSDDIYPKVPSILKGIAPAYETLVPTLLEAAKLPKSKKVFDNSKVTDHHAIIPTGVRPAGMDANEAKVYDMVARRFIAAFYPDCKIATTSVLGEAGEVEFKANGKVILSPGWRVVFEDRQTDEKSEEEKTLPDFQEGEQGPHEPSLNEKMTSPPKPYTEATLLRAMETAGKNVEDEALREAMKENGIGRPSTRASIIETLLKRDYIRKERKNLIPTETGIQLIQTIHQDLLKSAELTGQWEKKLRDIEKGEYKSLDFMKDLKEMVSEVVYAVKSDKTGELCPLCRQGRLIRGKQSYGCSRWKEGCQYRASF